MKRFILLTVSVITMFLTTGCIKCSYNFEIDKNGNLMITETSAINDKMLKTVIPDENDLKRQLYDARKDLEKDGFKVENYRESNYTGLKRSKIYDIKTFKQEKLPAGFGSKKLNPFEIKEGFLKNTLDIQLSYNYKKAQENMEKVSNLTNINNFNSIEETSDTDILQQDKTIDNETEDITEDTSSSMLEDNPEMKPSADLTIKIPYKTIKHNATRIINDNEYQWELATQGDVNITLKAEKINWSNIIGTLFVLVALIVGLIFWNKYKETTSW